MDPSQASPLFTFIVGFLAGAGVVYWLMRNKAAEVDALRARLRDLDDQRRA